MKGWEEGRMSESQDEMKETILSGGGRRMAASTEGWMEEESRMYERKEDKMS